MFGLAMSISLTGVIYFLIALCVLAILIVGVKWLLAQMGVAVPPPIWAILGFLLFLLILLWFLGAFGSGGVTFR